MPTLKLLYLAEQRLLRRGPVEKGVAVVTEIAAVMGAAVLS